MLFVTGFGLPTVGLQFVVLFGNVISCRLVIVYRHFRDGCCHHVEGLAVKDQEPEHGVTTLLRNAGNTAEHNVKLESSIMHFVKSKSW